MIASFLRRLLGRPEPQAPEAEPSPPVNEAAELRRETWAGMNRSAGEESDEDTPDKPIT